MELLLVRHARPEVVAGGTQAADPGLTEAGWEQASRVLAERDGYREILSANESLHMRLG